MTLVVNSVIQWEENSNGYEFERILWIDRGNDLAIVFPLTPDVNHNTYPDYRVLSDIEDSIRMGLAHHRTLDPFSKIVDAEYIEKYGEDRDKAWERIKEIALDEPDIYNKNLRGKMVNAALEKHGTTKKTIYKSLRKYWRYGKTPDSLLPLFNNCGAPGKEREITTEMIEQAKKEGRKIPKRGRPVIGSKDNPIIEGINLTDKDKENIKEAIKRYFYTPEKLSFEEVHSKMLEDSYFVINENSGKIIDPLRRYPSVYQLKEIYYKNRDIVKEIKTRHGEKEYHQNFRPVLGYSTQNKQIGPGSYYQMDSTILGVYIVNRLARDKKLKKPIVYLVMDVMSRKIVGCHIGLGTAWEDAKMALLDAFLNQGENSNNIKDDISKVCYLPKVIVADNGPELKGYNSDSIANYFSVRVTQTPSYRPDWKPIIEQEFNQLRIKFRNIDGSSKKGYRERGEKNPVVKAVLDIEDLREIVQLIIEEHNNHHLMENYPLEKAMILDDVEPYPINLWNWGIEKAGAFNQISTDKAIIGLLPQAKATITENGIKFKKKYYSCSSALKDGWFVRSGPHEGKKVNIAYDYRNTGLIYLIKENGQSIEPCSLTPISKDFENYRVEEVDSYFTKRKERANLSKHDRKQVNIDTQAKIDKILENARQKTFETQKQNPMSETKQIKEVNLNTAVAKEYLQAEVSQNLHHQVEKLLNPNKDEETVRQYINDESESEEFIPVQPKLQNFKNQLRGWRGKSKGS